jgi:hypothetical protein
MVDVWQPTSDAGNAPDLTVLKNLASQSDALQQGQPLATINDSELASARSWIQLSEEAWQESIQQLTDQERLQLATFYTVAEVKLSGWQARDKNPAIWIFRYLKKNGQLPEKEFIKALKSQTDNRFIPYGSVL